MLKKNKFYGWSEQNQKYLEQMGCMDFSVDFIGNLWP